MPPCRNFWDPSNSIIMCTILSCLMEIPISAYRILCIDDLQFICDEFEACEAETEKKLRLRLSVPASHASNSSHIDLSVEANTNLCRKRKADNIDMKLTNAIRPVRQYIVRVCGGGHGGMQSVSISVALKNFRQVKKNFNVTMEIMHPEDRRNFCNDSRVITWLEQSDSMWYQLTSTKVVMWSCFLTHCFPACHFSIMSHRPFQENLAGLGYSHPIGTNSAACRASCGFPSGDSLKCPVFLQDKMRYIVFVSLGGLVGLVVVLWCCVFIKYYVLGGMRDVATHGRFERSTVADYVIMFIVLLSDCVRIRHHARSAIAEGGRGDWKGVDRW